MLCHSCILVICFWEGCNTKGQETDEKWSVEAETGLVEVETRSVEVENDQVGPSTGRKFSPISTPKFESFSVSREALIAVIVWKF